MTSLVATDVYGYERGKKFFELSNHLGNVLVTVTDRKNGVRLSTDTTLVDYYLPDIASANDYYPFGMTMPGRSSHSDKYRYGFNGKEKDDDLHSLTAYDYGFRIYNPALGRFLSVDPLTRDYPWYTPYQFAGNMPVNCIDLDGLEPIEVACTYVQKWNGSDRYIVDAKVILQINVKILDLTVNRKEEAQKYIEARTKYDITFKSIEGGIYYPMKFHPDGWEMYPNRVENTFVRGSFHFTFKFEVVASAKDLKEDNIVVVLSDDVTEGTARDATRGIAIGSAIAIDQFNVRTTLHELMHYMGLRDEYEKRPHGTVSGKHNDNLMDLAGWNLTSEQVGEVIGSYLNMRGGEKVRGKGKMVSPLSTWLKALKRYIPDVGDKLDMKDDKLKSTPKSAQKNEKE